MGRDWGKRWRENEEFYRVTQSRQEGVFVLNPETYGKKGKLDNSMRMAGLQRSRTEVVIRVVSWGNALFRGFDRVVVEPVDSS